MQKHRLGEIQLQLETQMPSNLDQQSNIVKLEPIPLQVDKDTEACDFVG